MKARSPLAPVLVVTGWALLGLGWLMATPPFKSPDETAHYVRAVGLSEGDLVGPRADFRAPALNVIGLTPAQDATFDNNTREVELPPGLAPSPCEPGASGTCTIATYVGNYQPLPYLLPAVAVRAADNPSTGDRLARTGALAGVLTFLALGVAVVWSGAAISLVGITAAVTPMVLFTGSMMNPSGLGIAASLALTAAVVRIHRDGGRPPPWVFGGGRRRGAALVATRPDVRGGQPDRACRAAGS